MKRSGLLLLVFQIVATGLLINCSNDEADQFDREEQFDISGNISGLNNEGVTVSTAEKVGTSNANGEFEILDLNLDTYEVVPTKTGYYSVPESRTVNIVEEDVENVDFEILFEDELQYNGAAWELFNSEVYTIKQNEGSLIQVDLTQNALWFQNDQGGLVYQTVTGDFEIQGRVLARKLTNDQEEVECSVCLGGLMARNPDNGSGENYVHLVTGNTPEGIGVEHKSTINGASDFDATNDGLADFDLRMVRKGNDFILSKRTSGATEWVEVITYNRPDLPATLQLGFNIYTAASGTLADLSVIYENVVISQ